MNLEMHTTRPTTSPSKLVATILMALRRQRKEDGDFSAVQEIAGPVQEIPMEYVKILRMVLTKAIYQKILRWPLDVRKLCGYTLKVFVTFHRCNDDVWTRARNCWI